MRIGITEMIRYLRKTTCVWLGVAIVILTGGAIGYSYLSDGSLVALLLSHPLASIPCILLLFSGLGALAVARFPSFFYMIAAAILFSRRRPRPESRTTGPNGIPGQ